MLLAVSWGACTPAWQRAGEQASFASTRTGESCGANVPEKWDWLERMRFLVREWYEEEEKEEKARRGGEGRAKICRSLGAWRRGWQLQRGEAQRMAMASP